MTFGNNNGKGDQTVIANLNRNTGGGSSISAQFTSKFIIKSNFIK